MKKQYIVSVQNVHAPKLFSVEERLKAFGLVEMLCNYAEVASVFRVTTEDPMCDAQKIKFAIKGLINPLQEKVSIFRVDKSDCDATEGVVEPDNQKDFPYCFSHFKSIEEARDMYEKVKPSFIIRRDNEFLREMTFPEYLLNEYSDHKAKEIDYEKYLRRFLVPDISRRGDRRLN